MSIINEVMCESLRKCKKNDDSNRPFTPSSLLKHLKGKDCDLYEDYRLRAFIIIKQMVMSQYQKVYENIQSLADWLLENMGVAKNNEFLTFMSGSYIPNPELPQQEKTQIQTGTVHQAKGQTHCATLYVETMYQGKYESIHVISKEKKKATKTKAATYYPNPFYKEIGKQQKGAHIQSAMKMTYVGLSRPTHLLCYAMHKSSYELYNAEKLKECGWQIIDLT